MIQILRKENEEKFSNGSVVILVSVVVGIHTTN